MSRKFEVLAIFLGILENFFVGGIIFGWPSLVFCLKNEGVFNNVCENSTQIIDQQSNKTYSCAKQDEIYNRIFTLAVSMVNFAVLPYGLLLYRYNLLICRIFVIIPVTLGMTLLIFYDTEALFTTGMILIGTTSFGIFTTNLTIQPLGRSRTSLIGALLGGAYDSASGVFLIIKEIYVKNHASLQISLAILAFFSILTWMRTGIFMPVEKMKRKLPENYDLIGNSLVRKGLCTAKDGENIRLSENTEDSTALIPLFSRVGNIMKSPKFYLYAFWFFVGSFRCNSYMAWFNPALEWWFPHDYKTHSLATSMLGVSSVLALLISAFPGWTIDALAKGKSDKMAARSNAIALLSIFCIILGILESIMFVIKQNVGAMVTSQIFFQIHRTAVYVTAAQSAFLLFPEDLFAVIWGLILAINGALAFIIDPLFRLIQENLNGDFAPVQYGLIAFLTLSSSYPIYLFYQNAKK